MLKKFLFCTGLFIIIGIVNFATTTDVDYEYVRKSSYGITTYIYEGASSEISVFYKPNYVSINQVVYERNK